MDRPRVRFVEVQPYGDRFLIRDPYGLSPPLMVSSHLLLLMSLMDGSRDENEIKAEFFRRTGSILSSEDYSEVLRLLDENLLLLNGRFQKALQDLRDRMLSSKVLKPYHAGEAYPKDPKELRKFLDSSLESSQKEHPLGILVPHMDMRVALSTYGKVYGRIGRRPDTVLILGVSHYLHETPFSVCPLDLETPLGVLEVDLEVVERLRKNFEHDIFQDILSYRMEHSIEFQAVFVKHLFPEARAVPAIVSYGNEGSLRETALRLARAIEDRNLLVISSVDMSHVGRKFGDPFSYDPSFRDKEYIKLLERLDSSSAFRLLESDSNRTRIDGQFTNYVFTELLKELGARKGREVDYQIYHEEPTDSKVSYAGMTFS